MIRTKIVATLGPATAAPQRMYELFKAGVDVCRLNFSHGDLESHGAMLRTISGVTAPATDSPTKTSAPFSASVMSLSGNVVAKRDL